MKELELVAKEEETICGFSRRDISEFCTPMAVGHGLPIGMGGEDREAVDPLKSSPVLWLSARNAPMHRSPC